MPRFAKKNSTRIDILKKMFSELKKDENGRLYEIGNDEIANITEFEAIPESRHNELIEAYIEEKLAYREDSKACKDLQKINFDFENCGYTDDKDNYPNHNPKVHDNGKDAAFNQLPDGTAIIWGWAGGDWEMDVNFILYLDPSNTIRAYIPSEGNVYCHKCKAAYGSCDCDEDELPNLEEEGIIHEFDKMYADVCNRIQTK